MNTFLTFLTNCTSFLPSSVVFMKLLICTFPHAVNVFLRVRECACVCVIMWVRVCSRVVHEWFLWVRCAVCGQKTRITYFTNVLLQWMISSNFILVFTNFYNIITYIYYYCIMKWSKCTVKMKWHNWSIK